MIARTKVSKGGKVFIPVICRKHLKIQEGTEIIFSLNEQDEMVITPITLALKKARAVVNKYHNLDHSLVEELITRRRAEAQNE